jgi:hypothetical protein
MRIAIVFVGVQGLTFSLTVALGPVRHKAVNGPLASHFAPWINLGSRSRLSNPNASSEDHARDRVSSAMFSRSVSISSDITKAPRVITALERRQVPLHRRPQVPSAAYRDRPLRQAAEGGCIDCNVWINSDGTWRKIDKEDVEALKRMGR